MAQVQNDKQELLIRTGLNLEPSYYEKVRQLAKHHPAGSFSAYVRWLIKEHVESLTTKKDEV